MTKLSVDGVDISHHQDYEIDFAAAKKAGVKFGYHKVTEGSTVVDGQYKMRREQFNKAKLPVGGYHFARPSKTDAVAEAQFFLKHLQFKLGDLVPCLDLEDDGNLSKAELTKWVTTWMLEVEKATKVKPIIYTNFSLNSTFGAYLWQARYNNDNRPPQQAGPWPRWHMWQFSNGTFGDPKRVAGFPGKTDLNHFNTGFTLDKILTQVPPPPPPPTPKTKSTRSFRIVTQNVKALPLMPQIDVRHDIMLTASQAGIIGWQEIEPARYDSALRELEATGKWDTYWGHPRDEVGAKVEGYDTPISWRKKYWTQVDGGKFKLNEGRAHVSKTLWVTWIILKHKSTGLLFYYDNAHYIPGAFNNNPVHRKKERPAWWKESRQLHLAHLRKMIAAHPEMPLCCMGDYNAQQKMTSLWTKEIAGRKVRSGTLGNTSIDQILFINGKGHYWQIDRRETLPGRNSDHQGRRALVHLTWRV